MLTLSMPYIEPSASLGAISQSEYWSSARSGGQNGLGVVRIAKSASLSGGTVGGRYDRLLQGPPQLQGTTAGILMGSAAALALGFGVNYYAFKVGGMDSPGKAAGIIAGGSIIAGLLTGLITGAGLAA